MDQGGVVSHFIRSSNLICSNTCNNNFHLSSGVSLLITIAPCRKQAPMISAQSQLRATSKHTQQRSHSVNKTNRKVVSCGGFNLKLLNVTWFWRLSVRAAYSNTYWEKAEKDRYKTILTNINTGHSYLIFQNCSSLLSSLHMNFWSDMM